MLGVEKENCFLFHPVCRGVFDVSMPVPSVRIIKYYLSKSMKIFGISVLAALILFPVVISAQNRDFQAERIVIDDDGDDGVKNTMTIQTPDPLSKNVVVTIPEPTSSTASFLLYDSASGTSLAWLLGGNSGTIAGTDFLGTTDSAALHIYVNSGANNSLILNLNNSIQRSTGGDARDSHSVDMQSFRDAPYQVASGDLAVIGGGSRNMASAQYSTVAGGDSNVASGRASTVGGGGQNTASGDQSVVAGGVLHVASGLNTAIVGGFQNTALSDGDFIGAGTENIASGTNSVVVGGVANVDSATSGFIGAGDSNLVSGVYAAVVAGTGNQATGYKSFIGGGDESVAEGEYSVVVGGNENYAYGWKNFIGGGDENVTDSAYAVVAGGNENYAVEVGAFVGGGEHNFNEGEDATISGGFLNEAYGIFSTVAGGVANIAVGEMTAIPGGAGLILEGNRSFGFLGGNTSDNDMLIADSNVAVFGNVDLWLANNDTTASQLRFYEAESEPDDFPSGTNYTSFEAGTQSADINYILPLSTTAGTTVEEGLLQLDDATGQLSWVDPAEVVSGQAWLLSGNSGTTAGTDFLGTTDNTAFHIKVNSTDVMIFNTNGSIQRDNGGNARGTDAVDLQRSRDVSSHVASGQYGVIGGGRSNEGKRSYGTISGGRANLVDGDYASIGGGDTNLAISDYGTIGGGYNNRVAGIFGYGTIGGGYLNAIEVGDYGTIGGGDSNRVEVGDYGTIGGGSGNIIFDNDYAIIGGGQDNNIDPHADYGTIGGGFNNYINESAPYATIGGGGSNSVSTLAEYAMISGGQSNTIESGASWATINGGAFNTVGGMYSTIAGGRGLTLDTDADRSFGFLANSGSNDMTISAADVAVFGNADLWLANNNSSASQIRFYEPHGTTGSFPGAANYTSFQAGAQTADINYTLPTSAPTADGQVMTATTAGDMSWSAGLEVDEDEELVKTGGSFGMVLGDPDTNDDGILDATAGGANTAVPFGTLRYDTSADKVQAFVSDSDGGGTDGWINLH